METVNVTETPLTKESPDMPARRLSEVRRKEMNMTAERAIRALAGALVLTSLVLSRLASPWWLLLALFVGANLLQSAFTNFCPAERIMRRARLFEVRPAPSAKGRAPGDVPSCAP